MFFSWFFQDFLPFSGLLGSSRAESGHQFKITKKKILPVFRWKLEPKSSPFLTFSWENLKKVSLFPFFNWTYLIFPLKNHLYFNLNAFVFFDAFLRELSQIIEINKDDNHIFKETSSFLISREKEIIIKSLFVFQCF